MSLVAFTRGRKSTNDASTFYVLKKDPWLRPRRHNMAAAFPLSPILNGLFYISLPFICYRTLSIIESGRPTRYHQATEAIGAVQYASSGETHLPPRETHQRLRSTKVDRPGSPNGRRLHELTPMLRLRLRSVSNLSQQLTSLSCTGDNLEGRSRPNDLIVYGICKPQPDRNASLKETTQTEAFDEKLKKATSLAGMSCRRRTENRQRAVFRGLHDWGGNITVLSNSGQPGETNWSFSETFSDRVQLTRRNLRYAMIDR